MSVTDLTNTKWLINTKPYVTTPYNRYYYDITYNINFTSNNTSYNGLYLDDDQEDEINYISYVNNGTKTSVITQNLTTGGTMLSQYCNITITGGTDATNQYLISWLENNAIQIPSDLTDTTWLLNNDLSGAATIGSQGIIYLNFVSNNTTFNRIDTSEMESDGLLGYWATNSYIEVFNSIGGGWINQAYRTITITGGTDVSNTELINWLIANATQLVVSDLTNTTWFINSTPTINPPNIALTNITYTTNNVQCTSMFIGYIPELDTENEIWYYNPNATGDTNFCAYSTQTGWSNQAYRTITITGGTDVTNSNFIIWLQNNATQQETPTPTPSSTGKIGDLPIIKKHFGSLEIIKEVLNGSVIYESSPQENYNYEFQNGTLTINDAPYTINDGILNIGE